MTFSLKPIQLVAHWVPGFVLLGILVICDVQNSGHYLAVLTRALGAPTAWVVIAILAFPTGLIFDALRDLGEWGADRLFRRSQINWQFIWDFSAGTLRQEAFRRAPPRHK